MISKIVKSIWKPWNYLVGTGDEEETPEVASSAPNGPAREEEPATKKADDIRTSSPGEWIYTVSNA